MLMLMLMLSSCTSLTRTLSFPHCPFSPITPVRLSLSLTTHSLPSITPVRRSVTLIIRDHIYIYIYKRQVFSSFIGIIAITAPFPQIHLRRLSFTNTPRIRHATFPFPLECEIRSHIPQVRVWAFWNRKIKNISLGAFHTSSSFSFFFFSCPLPFEFPHFTSPYLTA